MEAFNAVGLTPISSLLSKPRKFYPHPTTTNPVAPPLKSSSSSSSDYSALNNNNNNRSFHGGLVLLSSVLLSPIAAAHSLTYEEALQQSLSTSNSSSDVQGLSFDAVSGILDGIISFGSENPLLVAGGATALALPLLLSQLLFKKSKPWGIETARAAYAKLGDDADAQLLDLRPLADLRQVGGPDVRGLGKKPVPIVYRGEDKPGFLKKLSLKFKDPESTTLFILDKFDGNSELVAELVTVNGFKAAFAIKDGAEGPRGWMNSGLPWVPPKKGFSLDFSSLTDAIGGTVGDGLDGLSVALGIAVAAGLGALAFTEVETILQVLGSAALIQFVSKKLLFAEDRKQTIQQLDEFVNNKVGPKELADDVKQIGKALLPLPVTSKSLPAPTTTPAAATTETTTTVSTETATTTTSSRSVEKIKAAAPAEAEAEAEAEAKKEAESVNSVPKPEEVKAEPLIIPGIFPRPQSPYPYYPDLKPPTSPSPSQP